MWVKGVGVGAVALVIALCQPSAPPPSAALATPAAPPAAAPALTPERGCQALARDGLTAPTTAEWGPILSRTMAGPDGGPQGVAIRGEATAQNGLGVPITHRFVCVMVPSAGKGQVFFRSSNPEMYAEVVRLAGLE